VPAEARALAATAGLRPGPGGGLVRVDLEPSPTRETSWFRAIPERGVARCDYDGTAVDPMTIAALEAAARSDAVDLLIITDRVLIETVLSLVVEGNTDQFTDPAFLAELKSWVRFDASEAIRTGDGLFTGTTGNPSVPSWLGRLIFGLVASPRKEADRYTRQIRSSAGIAIFVGKQADPAHWVACGRSYQRFALEATVRGLRHAFINQAVEVPPVREQLAAAIGMPGRRPDLIVRFGHGPAMPPSLRRAVSAVLAGAATQI
jgi:hypothetical protein